MSHWADLFRSLAPDTADTTDATRPAGAASPRERGSVVCVPCVLLESAGRLGAASDLLTAALAGTEALAAPDPELARERAEIAAALATEAAGEAEAPTPPECHRAAVAGLLGGFAAHVPLPEEGAPR